MWPPYGTPTEYIAAREIGTVAQMVEHESASSKVGNRVEIFFKMSPHKAVSKMKKRKNDRTISSKNYAQVDPEG